MSLVSIEDIVLQLAEEKLGKKYIPVFGTDQVCKDGMWSSKSVVIGYRLASEIKDCTACAPLSRPTCLVCLATGKFKVTYIEGEG